MYCAGCGLEIGDPAAMCPRCGRKLSGGGNSAAGSSLPFTGFERAIQRMGWYWMLFAGLNVVLGVCGIFLVQTEITRLAGPWEPWPHPPLLEWTYMGAAAWALLGVRIMLSVLAGLGLRMEEEWGRTTAICAAVVGMTQFPIGLILGAYTLIKLTGHRHAAMYHQLSVV